jgi:hypothetical protein
MIREALYLVLAIPFLGACSGKVDLGNGNDTDGGGNEGGTSSSNGAGGSSSGGTVTGGSGMGGSGGSGSGGGGPSSGGVVVGSSDEAGVGVTMLDEGGVIIGASEAGVASGGGDASCFPDCVVDASLGGYTLCGKTECGPGESCIATQTSGGPCLPPGTGGTCPKGTTLDGGCCVATPATSYVCQITPPACGGALTCGCSTSLCDMKDGCFCSGVKDNVLRCDCAAP